MDSTSQNLTPDTQTSGKKPFSRLSAEEKSKAADQYLDDFETRLGLTQFSGAEEGEAAVLLQLSPEQRYKMTADQCADATFVLARYAGYIARALNRERAKVVWVKSELMKAIAQQMNQITAYSFDERKFLAISQNEHAQKLQSLAVEAETKAERLSFLPKHIEDVAKAFELLSNTRRRYRENA